VRVAERQGHLCLGDTARVHPAFSRHQNTFCARRGVAPEACRRTPGRSAQFRISHPHKKAPFAVERTALGKFRLHYLMMGAVLLVS